MPVRLARARSSPTAPVPWQPGPGGWAWALDTSVHASGREAPSTNQRMEVRAALEAVRARSDGPLLVVSRRLDVRRELLPRRLVARLAGAGWTNSRPAAGRQPRPVEPLVTLVAERGDVALPGSRPSGHVMNDFVDSEPRRRLPRLVRSG